MLHCRKLSILNIFPYVPVTVHILKQTAGKTNGPEACKRDEGREKVMYNLGKTLSDLCWIDREAYIMLKRSRLGDEQKKNVSLVILTLLL